MKNLKKFNENWIDDETEDTDRRMDELDREEGIIDPEVASPEEEEFIDKLFDLIGEYRNKLSVTEISTVLTDIANQPEIWSGK